MHDNVDTRKRVVRHNNSVYNHRAQVQLPRALGTVTHGEDKLRADEQDTGVA